jgi:hypothetical protein
MKELHPGTEQPHHIHLTPAEQDELHHDSLGEKLRILIGKLPPDEVSIAEIRELVGKDGLLLLIIFLSLVFVIPIQFPGMGGVLGFMIILIVISRMRGRKLWLPRRIAQHSMSPEKVREVMTKSTVWLQRLEYVCRPHRFNWLVSSGIMDVINHFGIIIGALLLIAPIILVPLSNTLPALAVLFLAMGLLQRDGLCILYGHFVNIATITYFTALFIGGHEAVAKIIRFFGHS